MQIHPISFTSEQPQKKESSLYNKKNYMQLVNVGRFMEGTFLGFGVLETVDKFRLIKNKNNLLKEALKAKAWKHTKWNILGGIAAGFLTLVTGKVLDKKLIPWNEKLSDKIEKQEAINKKAKELVEQEKIQNSEKSTETPNIEKPAQTKELAEETKKEK